MLALKRLFEDCPACENRGLIYVGKEEADFPCPRCNAWCSFCLEQPDAQQRPRPGGLLAAVRHTDAGLELFEGYLCDWHIRFQGYISIAPAMIGRFKPGDAFIAVQTIVEPHAFVELYGYAEAHNHRELEAAAFQAVATQRHSRYGRDGFFVCPPELAARALVPDWVTWQAGELRDRRILPSGARLTMWASEPSGQQTLLA